MHKKKTAKFEQNFVQSWLHDSEFKPWLSKKPGKDGKLKPFCSWCDIQITCSKTRIRRHSLSPRHCSNKKTCGTNLSIQAMWNNNQFAKEIELRICAFIAEHALSRTLVEPLITLLRVLFPNDNNLRSVKLGKQKAIDIVRQVFAFDYLQSAVKTLKEHKFSIIIDERTDRSSVKQLALLACYFDLESFVLKNYLIDPVECTDSSAVGLYSALKSTLNGMNIPMENIIGYLGYSKCNVRRAPFCFSTIKEGL